MMIKKHSLYPFFVFLLLVSACKRASIESTSVNNTQHVLSKDQINNRIASILKAKNDFRWADLNEQELFEALKHAGNILSIGYKPQSWTKEQVDAKMHMINMESQEWQEAKKQILQLVWEEEKKSKPSLKMEELEIYPQKHSPVICVQVYNLNTVQKLRASALMRYAEPMNYIPSSEKKGNQLHNGPFSSFGCGRTDPRTGLIQGEDYLSITPKSKASWNYVHHGIPEAWKISSGKGIKVMVIDTGCSLDQENLQGSFNQGESTGRTVEHIVTLRTAGYVSEKSLKHQTNPWVFRYGDLVAKGDQCGHGTMMSGVVAAPRGTDGNMCGIAYNCNLVTVKASKDVVIDDPEEIKGVVDAFEYAASKDDIKIISMSMGSLFHNSQIADAIKKAANRGKLIFCAAGTTLDYLTFTKFVGVVFPASMPEVIAVTGIQDNLETSCDVCHEGGKVEFVVVMQKKHPRSPLLALTMPLAGDVPAVDGGSSVATASMAGMAAIIWSKYPNKPAYEILRILKSSSTNPYKNIYWGAGILDVYKALTFDGIFGPNEYSEELSHPDLNTEFPFSSPTSFRPN